MIGKGILTGMGVTIQEFFRKKVTEQYPDVRPKLTERFRGGQLELDVEKCIACNICAMNCPNGSIKVSAAKGEDGKRRLSGYQYNSGLCLFCNLCIENCPQKCIEWNKNFDASGYSREDLVYDCIAQARARQGARKDEAAAETPQSAEGKG